MLPVMKSMKTQNYACSLVAAAAADIALVEWTSEESLRPAVVVGWVLVFAA